MIVSAVDSLDEDTFRVHIQQDGEEKIKHLPDSSLIKYLFRSPITKIKEENGQVKIKSERKEVTVSPHSVQW